MRNGVDPELSFGSAEHIYHIVRRAEWDAALSDGTHRPTSLESEGFIHCSTAGQVARVAEDYYGAYDDLLLLHIDVTRVEPDTRFEGESEGFPHIYGALDLAAVVHVQMYAADLDGSFPAPEPVQLNSSVANEEDAKDAGD